MTQPLELGQRPPEALISHEKSLPGTKAVVTGGSRDIGAAIVKTLATQGVEVVSSFNNKQKRADKVAAEVGEAGGVAHFLQADISTSEGRAGFVESTLGITPEIDFLVLNTSGDTAALNQEASDDLVSRFLPHMKDGGTIVRLQSVPGRYAPQLRGLGKMISLYDDVAERKYEDVQNLRGRIPEFAERGIRFLEITPPVVDGTSNMMLFNMAAKRETGGTKTAEEMHDEISDKLGLPRKVTQEQVADEILDLFIRSDVPSGHTEMFGDVQDSQTVLENWYDTDRVYVQTYEKTGEVDGQKTGIGRAIVSKEQAERSGEPFMLDSLNLKRGGKEYYGELLVTPEHAKGHLDTEKGFPAILPGHKQIRAAIDTVGWILNKDFPGLGKDFRLKSFSTASFTTAVLADGTQRLTIQPIGDLIVDGDKFGYEIIEIVNEKGEKTAQIENIFVTPVEPGLNSTLLEDQMIEGAAQASGAVLLEEINPDVMPLFMKVGPVEFSSRKPQAGDGVEYRVSGKGTKRSVNGSVEIYSDGELVGHVDGIRALVSAKEDLFKRIGFTPAT